MEAGIRGYAVTLVLVPGEVTLDQLEHLWRSVGDAKLTDSARSAIEAAAALVMQAAVGGRPSTESILGSESSQASE